MVKSVNGLICEGRFQTDGIDKHLNDAQELWHVLNLRLDKEEYWRDKIEYEENIIDFLGILINPQIMQSVLENKNAEEQLQKAESHLVHSSIDESPHQNELIELPVIPPNELQREKMNQVFDFIMSQKRKRDNESVT